jgi:cytoskeletal protein RodZ
VIATVFIVLGRWAALGDAKRFISEIYLGLAAAFIFGACLFAAKKSRLRIKTKQILLIALLAVVMVCLIWVLVGMWSNKRPEPREKFPSYSPPETAVSNKSELFAATSTGADSIDTMSNSVEPCSLLSGTVSPALRPSNA